MEQVNGWPVDRRVLVKWGAILVLCFLGVLVMDLTTNTLNRTFYRWDFIQYYDMAENGLIGNDHLIAPFAYRFVTPLLAGLVADLSSVSTEAGFRVVAYIGAVAQLALVFRLAEYLGLTTRAALVPVLVVAFSLYNLKFLLFDVSRPDHLAYPLMAMAVLALFYRQWGVCLAVSCAGLLVRECLIIPPVLMLVELFHDYRREHAHTTLAWMVGTVVAVGLFVIVPRAVIPVEVSGQYLDPVHQSDWLDKLIEAPLSERRDVNLVFNLVSYLLPVGMLVTWQRARRMWARLAGYRLFLGLYTGAVLVLVMYGGTDIWRFMTYLFIPQVMILAAVLRENSVDSAEILYMLVAVAVYNKIFLDRPNLLDPYLDFYGGYDNRINVETLWRWYELTAYRAGVILLRTLLSLSRRGWFVARRTADQ